MKKFLATLVLGVASLAAHAEATFDQIQMLIQQQNYSAAEKGLEEIIRNHPKSAKAFYAMSQAQAGLGNQEKAKKALDIATGLNPTLDFAPQSSVASLKEAITPQVKKIESIEESHTGRNLLIVLLLVVIGGTAYVLYNRKKDEEESARKAKEAEAEAEASRQAAESKRKWQEMVDNQEAERQALRQHPNYGHDRFDPTNPDVLKPLPKKKTKAELKAEADALAVREAQARVDAAEAEARSARIRESAVRNSGYSTQPTQTVVHTNSGNDMLTGVLIGNMLGGHHNHESTRVVEREVIREVEAPVKASRSSWDDIGSSSSNTISSSWDDTPTPSRSSSWNDTPSSSSRSSSWDDDSSSKTSSSWSSSSSSSDSSSSWD